MIQFVLRRQLVVHVTFSLNLEKMTTRTSVRDYIPSVNSDTEPLIQSNKNNTKKVRLSVRDAEHCSKLDSKIEEENEMRDVPCSYLLFKAFVLFAISLMGWSMFLAMDLQGVFVGISG